MDPGDLHLDIMIEDQRWTQTLPDLEKMTRKALEACFKIAEIKLPCPGRKPEISIVFADDKMVHQINKTYRNKDKPTNVISFAYLEDEKHPEQTDNEDFSMGDIILSYETVEQEATEQQKSLQDHTVHLIVHGCLHLFGYHHDNDLQAQDMEDKEVMILREMNVKNPYMNEKNVAY